MPDKSYVTMEQQVCVVCGTTFDTGNLLLDRRLKDRFELHTVVGYGLCPEHKAMIDDGYIALVGIDPEKSVIGTTNIAQENAYRTGHIAFVRERRWEDLFDIPIPDKKIAFVEQAVIELLNTLL